MYPSSLKDILYLKDIYFQIDLYINYIYFILLINYLKQIILCLNSWINNFNYHTILFKNYCLYLI